ncbi:hypothetical protein AB1286_09510 [Trinickia sp. NRRL B-1857]|uniref:hypothetical protein n=1 Tax=Trinickia sp. NRRL B-1857 TaxID=3162879 RepID=UPI003D2BA059
MKKLRALLAAWRGNRFAHGLILMLPAIQYGKSYFLSVATVLFLWTAWNTRLRIVPLPIAMALIATGASLVFCAVVLPDEPILPREARFAVGLLFLFAALWGAPKHAAHRFDGRFALGMLIALFLVTAVQWVAAKKGIALFPPQRLFTNPDDQALASAWVEHAREHGYAWTIRPAAAFSEPSYLGCMTLLLQFLCLHTLRPRLRWLALFTALATSFLAQTYFGLTSNLLIFAAFHASRVPKSFALAAGVLALSAGLLAVETGALPAAAMKSTGRIERIVSGDDPSVAIRLAQPFQLLGDVFAHAPFGVPISAAESYFVRHRLIVPFQDEPFQNGVFNLVFAYGWLALPLLLLLWRASGGGVAGLFMLFVLAQNGAELNFDKLVIIVFAIQIARHGRYRATAPRQAPFVRESAPPRFPAPAAARPPLPIPEI